MKKYDTTKSQHHKIFGINEILHNIFINIEALCIEYIDNKGNIVYIETLTKWRNLLNIKQVCRHWKRVVKPILINKEHDKYSFTIITHCEICESLGILQDKKNYLYKYYKFEKIIYKEINRKAIL